MRSWDTFSQLLYVQNSKLLFIFIKRESEIFPVKCLNGACVLYVPMVSVLSHYS